MGLLWSGRLALSGEACLQLEMLEALSCHVAERLSGCWQPFQQPLILAQPDGSKLCSACIVLDGFRPGRC